MKIQSIQKLLFVEREVKNIKVNSKKKGNRVELELTKVLTDHFKRPFSRSVGSGNRWGQVADLPKHAREIFSGDICTPEDFSWVIECKGGYEDIFDVFGENKRLDEFIQQSANDAERCNKRSIVFWKRNRKKWLAILEETHIHNTIQEFKYSAHYKKWAIVLLDELLNLTNDDFWFDQTI